MPDIEQSEYERIKSVVAKELTFTSWRKAKKTPDREEKEAMQGWLSVA